jgi:hypothetical protein
MKKLFVFALLMALFATMASAELLITANPFGQGKWAVEGAYLMDSKVQLGGSTDVGMNTIGAYVGYGITSALDVIVQLGSATYDKLPVGVNSASGTGAGIFGKYAILQESNNMPVSVSAGLGYKSLSMTASTLLGNMSGSGSSIMAGLGVSKIFAPLVPYAGATYRSNTLTVSGTNMDSTQLDLTAGTAIAWSQNGAVYIEYTAQSMTPKTGAAYTQTQIAGGVGYKI